MVSRRLLSKFGKKKNEKKTCHISVPSDRMPTLIGQYW
jgi:hypothetical protein